MTISDLRVLVDNLDEYIHIPGGIDRLKKTVLHLAVSGQLAPQDPSEGTGAELYKTIQSTKAELVRDGRVKKQKPLPPITEDEIPFAIPESWEWVRLGDVTNYGSAEKAKPQAINPDTWVLELEDIEKETSKLLQKVSAAARASQSDKNVFYEGDVLYGKLRPYLDKVIVANEGGVCSSEILPLRTFGDNFEPQYLRLFLKSPSFVNIVNELTYGVKMPRLGTDDGRKMAISLPPLAEQKRIVAKADQIFALIDQLNVAYQAEESERSAFVRSSLRSLSHSGSQLALENLASTIRTKADAAELRKAVLHLAVSGQLAPQDPSKGTGAELYKTIQSTKAELVRDGKVKKQKPLPPITKDELPFAIPESWEWVRLGDVSDIFNGNSINASEKAMKYEKVEKGYPYIGTKDINYGFEHIDYDNGVKIPFDEADRFRIISAGTVLICSEGGSAGKKCGIVNSNVAFGNKMYAFKAHADAILPEFVLYNYLTKLFYKQFSSKMTGIIGGISMTNFKKLVIPLPSLSEQERIIAKATEILNLVHNFELALEGKREAVEETTYQPQIQTVTKSISVDTPQVLTNQEKKVQRKMLACFIANEAMDGVQLGKTKFEKLLHLVEYHVLKKDLNQSYSVQPAGPYDGRFTKLFWDDVMKSRWYKIEGRGSLQKIAAGDKHEKSRKDYGYLSDSEKSAIRDLIKTFNSWNYEAAEIISTLYAVWNNRLIKNEEINDDLLKQDFLQWDSQKSQYADRLDKALDWMRQNSITPDGWGREIKKAKNK